jgi:hypothetical protein
MNKLDAYSISDQLGKLVENMVGENPKMVELASTPERKAILLEYLTSIREQIELIYLEVNHNEVRLLSKTNNF